jgi:hypothetical protein
MGFHGLVQGYFYLFIIRVCCAVNDFIVGILEGYDTKMAAIGSNLDLPYSSDFDSLLFQSMLLQINPKHRRRQMNGTPTK